MKKVGLSSFRITGWLLTTTTLMGMQWSSWDMAVWRVGSSIPVPPAAPFPQLWSAPCSAKCLLPVLVPWQWVKTTNIIISSQSYRRASERLDSMTSALPQSETRLPKQHWKDECQKGRVGVVSRCNCCNGALEQSSWLHFQPVICKCLSIAFMKNFYSWFVLHDTNNTMQHIRRNFTDAQH